MQQSQDQRAQLRSIQPYFSFVLHQDTPGNKCTVKQHLRGFPAAST